MLDRNTRNHLTVGEKINSGLFKMLLTNYLFTNIFMYKQCLALNKLQVLIYLKIHQTNQPLCVIFWPSTRPKNTIPRWCTGRKWHIPMASNRKRSRGRIKAYNMGQGEGPTVPLQWCTGREWPVNCMTVISAWWRLNIRFQRSSGRSCGRWIIIQLSWVRVPKQLPADFHRVRDEMW